MWNKVKYRADKPLGELIDSLQKVGLWEAGEILMVADNVHRSWLELIMT